MWAIFAAFLFSFFGRWFFVAELLSNFRFQFGVLLLVAAFWSLVPKANWFSSICFLVASVWALGEVCQCWMPAVQPNAGPDRLRVMSFNVLATNERFEDAILEIRKHDPDVVAVLEYANRWHDAFDAINESHPFQIREPRWHGYGIAIFSKRPIENPQTVQLTEKVMDNPSVNGTIKIGGRKLRIVAMHVMSPVNRMRLDLRNRQFAEIAKTIQSQDVPTILLGDLNCAPSSIFFQELLDEAGVRDSRLGFGFQASWPTWATVLSIPIDHVLVSNEVHVHDRFLGDGGGSDHRPVIVDVSLSDAK
jgi:endonuclease/exonuclease/phosphatase (EEP) superfamily protein YafD